MSESSMGSAVQLLQQVTEGLLFTSETDAPLTPFFWPAIDNSSLAPEDVAKMAGIPADTTIKSVKLETFFRPVTKQEDWHNDKERAEIKRFQELVNTIKDLLEDVKVFYIGETSIDVFIVGKVKDGFAGLKTKMVET